MLIPPTVDIGAVLTEIAKYAAVGVVAFLCGKVTKWFTGYHETRDHVAALNTSVQSLCASVGELKVTFEERCDEMEARFGERFHHLEAQVHKVDESAHRHSNQAQAIINRQEGRLIRLEERMRLISTLHLKPHQAAEIDRLMPPEEETQ